MITITVCRWVLLSLAATPWTVLVLCLFLGVIPLQQALSPLPTSRSALELSRIWAQPAGTLGVVASLIVLSKGQSFLARLDPLSRWSAEFAALLASGLSLLLPIVAGALLAGAYPADVGRLAPAILVSSVHLASVALLLLQPALVLPLRIALFVALTWMLPALAPTAPLLAPVAALFDANGSLHAATVDNLASSFAATTALVLACHLVRR